MVVSRPVFVDTNVLLYQWDTLVAQKNERATAWMVRLFEERSGRVSFQVLVEFYRGATQKLKRPVPSDVAQEYVRTFFAWDPVAVDAAVIDDAWRALKRYRLAWWDALIVAAAQRSRCRTLLSEDFQTGQDFDGVVVVNPFTTTPDR